MTKERIPFQIRELKQALKDKNNARHHRKIQTLILYSESYNLAVAAKSVGFVHQIVCSLLNHYLEGGLQALLSENCGDIIVPAWHMKRKNVSLKNNCLLP